MFILVLKMLFDRERPTRILNVYRICNMRDLEHGKSMPSGDAAAAAYFCGTYIYLYGFYYFSIIIVPLVMLGRVYVHCHWFGDTIIGAFIGHFFAMICYRKESFSILAWPIF
jgi:membrane-associated phospholipid phosphatase